MAKAGHLREFNVFQFFRGGTQEQVLENVSVADAMGKVKQLVLDQTRQFIQAKRIIVTDACNNTVFEWRAEEGITFPPRLVFKT